MDGWRRERRPEEVTHGVMGMLERSLEPRAVEVRGVALVASEEVLGVDEEAGGTRRRRNCALFILRLSRFDFERDLTAETVVGGYSRRGGCR